jgi:hypothetical protein
VSPGRACLITWETEPMFGRKTCDAAKVLAVGSLVVVVELRVGDQIRGRGAGWKAVAPAPAWTSGCPRYGRPSVCSGTGTPS